MQFIYIYIKIMLITNHFTMLMSEEAVKINQAVLFIFLFIFRFYNQKTKNNPREDPVLTSSDSSD